MSLDTSRTVLAVTGTDRVKFLQDLVTNDLAGAEGRLIYAALLSPQGKYLFDFFVLQEDDRILIDVAEGAAAALAQRLTMYRLRADVAITATDIPVSRGLAPDPDGAFADPREAALGWRLYGNQDAAPVDWTALRVAHLVPETGAELIANDSYILECGFERLHGVDFRKGCYVGQEVTARMKHKTELRKGLARVVLDGEATPGDAILREGKAIGTLHTIAGDKAIAYLRFDQAGEGMHAGAAGLRLDTDQPA